MPDESATDTSASEYIAQLPDGISIGTFQDKTYQVSKETFTGGKSHKVFARELGGNDFISLNHYRLESGDRICPCEMPLEKVTRFLQGFRITQRLSPHAMINWNQILQISEDGNLEPDRRVEKTDEEWQAQLTPDQYRITRQHGTEMPFSSEMCSLIEAGKYACTCCDIPLFDSTEKFDSGTGWPSFTQPESETVIAYHADNSHGMVRVEVTCNVCDAHLGHVFPDGPEPTGLRYCINAKALRKIDGEGG